MGIEREHDAGMVGRALGAAVAREEARLARRLCYVGELAVRAAREEGSYCDQTGNLRASVGYAVSLDGRVVGVGGFGGDGGAGGEGGGEGREFALRCVGEYPRGGALVVVAGMRYAAYVSARGFDVLDSAELAARRLARELLGGG